MQLLVEHVHHCRPAHATCAADVVQCIGCQLADAVAGPLPEHPTLCTAAQLGTNSPLSTPPHHSLHHSTTLYTTAPPHHRAHAFINEEVAAYQPAASDLDYPAQLEAAAAAAAQAGDEQSGAVEGAAGEEGADSEQVRP